MKRRDTHPREAVAARLLEALYPGDERPGQRASVLDRIAAAQPGATDPVAVAGRALGAAYGTGSVDGQRAAVLDALERARPRTRAPRMLSAAAPSRDALFALASTLAAAVVLFAVLLGVRREAVTAPDAGPGGLTAEAQRQISAGARRPDGPRVTLAPVGPRPGVAGPAAASTPVHPAIAAMQRGCDQGAAVSCRRLGTLYQRGRGVAANRARAFELYDRACRAGDGRACALRDAADRSLNDVDRDDRADAEYFSTLGL